MEPSLGEYCDPGHCPRSESRRVAPELSAFAHGPCGGCDSRYVCGIGSANPHIFLRKMVLVWEYGHVGTAALGCPLGAAQLPTIRLGQGKPAAIYSPKNITGPPWVLVLAVTSASRYLRLSALPQSIRLQSHSDAPFRPLRTPKKNPKVVVPIIRLCCVAPQTEPELSAWPM